MRKPLPEPPDVQELQKLTKNAAENVLSHWEEECEAIMRENEIQFKKDLRKITLCAILTGLKKGFTLSKNSATYKNKAHYSWCNFDEWANPQTFGSKEMKL